MSPSWWYHEALAADRRAARRQLDLALANPPAEVPAVPPPPIVPVVDWCHYEQRGAAVNDHSVNWMLVLLLMMGSVTITILLFVVLFVTGIIGA